MSGTRVRAVRSLGARLLAVAVVVGALVLSAMLAMASPTLASVHHPKGVFAQFADCPLSNPSVEKCVFAEITGGEFVIGKRIVPISGAITLRGGTTSEKGENETLVAAEDGDTLSKTAMVVPGGLAGLIAPTLLPGTLRQAFNKAIANGATTVTGTAEFAGPVGSAKIDFFNMLLMEGTAIALPIKMKLSNVFLGNTCYIGSAANPVFLRLTSGITSPPPPNMPIRGSRGELTFGDEEFSEANFKDAIFVDNAFAAPQATGCGGGLSSVIDPIIDADLGLPAPAGHNTAILTGFFGVSLTGPVLASE